MMKNFFALISSLIFAFPGMTQPVISNVEPAIGDEFVLTLNVFNGFYPPGPAGTDINWDFSNLSSDGLFTLEHSVIDPWQAEEFESFPDATSVWYRESGDSYMYAFLNFENNMKTFLGNVGVGLGGDIYLDDYNDFFTFPLSYLTFGSGTYSGLSYNPFMSPIQIEGTTYYAADGYGTLETIYGVFSNVLRVTTVTEDTWTTEFDDVTATYSLNTSWYSTEHPIPVFTMDYTYNYFAESETDTIFSDTLTVFTYLALPTKVDERKADNTFKIYPNPASDYIVLGTEIQGEVALNIFSADGKLVMNQLVHNQEKIAINDLASGFYSAILTKDGTLFKPASFVVY